MTIEQIYKEYIEQLRNIYEEREATNIADWVFENITGIKRIERTLNKQTQLSKIVVEQLNNALEQLLQHRPIQYVLGEAWFYKMKLFVNKYVLIPRPETEELVEWIVDEVKMKNEKLKIIDVGVGSGCIAIALKKELVNESVSGIDVSAEALAVAKKNAADQGVNIDLLQIDFLNENSWHALPVFNIIVSNPPYIPEREKDLLEKNVVDYEPYSALFVSDNAPFIFYEKMAKFAVEHLEENGKMYVEVNEKYADEVAEIFS
ncbi:MAG: peptide chain release factor N(5)-glutamine methyltransferase, partial [Ginsengibacter sp.]